MRRSREGQLDASGGVLPGYEQILCTATVSAWFDRVFLVLYHLVFFAKAGSKDLSVADYE
jgi:hypothetical protein